MSGGGNFGAKRFPRTPKQVSERTSKQLRAKQYNPNTICSHVVGGTSQGRMPPSADYRVPRLGEWIEVWHVCLQEGRIVLHIYLAHRSHLRVRDCAAASPLGCLQGPAQGVKDITKSLVTFNRQAVRQPTEQVRKNLSRRKLARRNR